MADTVVEPRADGHSLADNCGEGEGGCEELHSENGRDVLVVVREFAEYPGFHLAYILFYCDF